MFPKAERLVDLFCGGLDVAINAPYPAIWANDKETALIEMYRYFHRTKPTTVMEKLRATFEEFGLRPMERLYYENGQNKEAYLRMRAAYNESHDPLVLFALLASSFNHQLRFNQQGKFNMPFGAWGKSHYNPVLEKNLKLFLERLSSLNIEWSNKDFRELEGRIRPEDFVYGGPLYTLGNAVYSGSWDGQRDLQAFLDRLSNRGIRWALSNVLEHDQTRSGLADWAGKYFIHRLSWNYHNASYQKKVRARMAGQVVLITNYRRLRPISVARLRRPSRGRGFFPRFFPGCHSFPLYFRGES